VTKSIQEQLDWYHAEIETKRKAFNQKRQEFFALDAEVSRIEREANRLFRDWANGLIDNPPLTGRVKSSG
jgi:predicted  nucleic acid-binding Zn-ribbon protein